MTAPGKPRIPRSGSQIDIPLAPTGPALAVTVDATISTATQIDLNANTTFIRVYAKTKDVAFRWGTTAAASATAAVFDEIIPAGQIVDIVRASDSNGDAYASCNVIETEATASVVVIEKR